LTICGRLRPLILFKLYLTKTRISDQAGVDWIVGSIIIATVISKSPRVQGGASHEERGIEDPVMRVKVELFHFAITKWKESP
jgi:hypothetical protein